jgi:hypothetical protein
MKHRNRSLRWGYLLFIASLTAIIFATISPFNFQIPGGFSAQFVLQEFKFASSVKDYWENILLFMPLGISLAMMLAPKQLSTPAILIVVCLGSILISSAVEITQFCLPSRVSNVTDIICNSLGGTLGGILYFWRSQIIQLLKGIVCRDFERLSLKSLLRAIACYCFLVMVSIWALAVNVNLSNWDDNFYLTIGNEVTGDRPWNGQISDLYISDRGLNPSEVQQVLKAFEFTPANSFLSYLPWERKNWIINLEKFKPIKAQILFYTIIMIPLSILGSYLLMLLRRTQNQ